MNEHISHFPIPDSLDELPEDIRATILAVQEKSGFIPNVFLMLSHRPDQFRAFFQFHDSLMERDTPSLSKAEREMIVVAMSAQHNCLYCVVAHGAILRIRAKDPYIADQIAINYRTAPITKRQRLMLDFAYHIAIEQQVMDTPWRDKLLNAGFTLDDIWDIGAIASFFGLSNRLVSLAGTPPNSEFYLMGRVPQEKK